MKKSLVALAAMSVIGAASAQSTVTLYGLVDAGVGVDRINGVSNTKVFDGTTNGQNGSRWGLKVQEDLGGGLAAVAQLESGFTVDTGASAQGGILFGRQAFVGLKSGFGTVSLGRQYGAYDDIKGALSLQGNNGFDGTNGPGVSGAAAGVTAGSKTIGAWRGYAARINNSIKFISANYSGFSAEAIVGLGEDKTATTSASASYGIGATYINGPIAVGLVYQDEGYARSVANKKNENENTLIAGSYDFGVAKVGAGYNENRITSLGVKGPKAKEWFLGLSAPLGATTLKLQYASSKVNSLTDSSIGIDAVYDFSKRTSAYVGYNVTKIDNGALADTNNRRFGVGLRHKF